jgi:hypothetical protein
MKQKTKFDEELDIPKNKSLIKTNDDLTDIRNRSLITTDDDLTELTKQDISRKIREFDRDTDNTKLFHEVREMLNPINKENEMYPEGFDTRSMSATKNKINPDRRELNKEMNRINELYQQYDLEMRKAGASDIQRQKMRDMMNDKKSELIAEKGDDLQKLNKFGKLMSKAKKALPVVGGIAAGVGALQSGDAAAAGIDFLVPGGLESVDAAPGLDTAIEKGQLPSRVKESMMKQQEQALEQSYPEDTDQIKQARLAAAKKLKEQQLSAFKRKTEQNQEDDMKADIEGGVDQYFDPRQEYYPRSAEEVQRQLMENEQDRKFRQLMGERRVNKQL